MVYRLHRTLKASLSCHNSTDWMGVLPSEGCVFISRWGHWLPMLLSNTPDLLTAKAAIIT